MALRNPLAPWLARLPPFWRRELGFLALWAGFGLLVMPFLIYFAGLRTLDPYEGGLPAFLGSLYLAFFTATGTAWLLVLGPYFIFTAVRLLTRPLRRGG
ncbi:MAG: hypothetical protein ACT4UP_08180 [Gammaproteobacteria bacterium]